MILIPLSWKQYTSTRKIPYKANYLLKKYVSGYKICKIKFIKEYLKATILIL